MGMVKILVCCVVLVSGVLSDDFSDDFTAREWLFSPKNKDSQITSKEPNEKEYKNDGTEIILHNREIIHYNLSDEALTWFDAKEACQAKGMSLAHPEDVVQFFELKKFLYMNNLVPADVFSGYWIDGRRKFSIGRTFTLQSGSEVMKLGWLPGEPNIYMGEDCVELKCEVFTRHLGFNNYYCQEKKRYICQELISYESTKNNKFDEDKYDDYYDSFEDYI